jgi:hypothetical protein
LHSLQYQRCVPSRLLPFFCKSVLSQCEQWIIW